jgi:hypothetical protein
MLLEKDFIDFVELLNKHEVDYMVVGGYALAFHGEPRTTGDMDIWIDCTEVNATRLVQVIEDFGMSALGLTEKDFLEPGIITQIGYPPLRIDILNEIDGVEFKDAAGNRQRFKHGKLEISFIGRQDFIKNKEAAGRKKDLKDVKRLIPKVSDSKGAKQRSIKRKR